jgi:signal transduction histidine kinase/ligand-binding sensor domain-containing protein
MDGASQEPVAASGQGLDPTRPLSQLTLDLWTEREGLPQNFITALAQTPDGYLWAGSERGLIRFDGRRFSVFTPEEWPGLPSPWVTALHADADGTLWIGSGGAGLARYRAGEFEPFGQTDELSGPILTRILRDDRGQLWVASEGRGVFRVDEEDGTVLRVGTAQGLSSEHVLDLAPDGTDGLWIATGHGLHRVDATTGQATPAHPEMSGLQVQSLVPGPEGSLVLGTAGQGVFEWNGEELSPLDPAGTLDGLMVSVLLKDRQGTLWIGTNGGGLFRTADGRVDALPSRPGVPTHLVRALLEDREGNLWIGLLAAGLARLQDGIFDHVGMIEGLSMNVALAVAEGPDGSIWAGTPGGGVNRIDGDEVTSWGTAEGLGSDFVISVSHGPDGSAWVGTVGGGVSRIHDGRVETFGAGDGLLGSHASVVHWDRAGHLWVGFGGQGLLRWRPGPSRTFGADEGLPSGFVTTVLDDEEGRMWIGTRDGLARIDGEQVQVFGVDDGLPHGFITGLRQDMDGVIWVATMGGLARIRGDEAVHLGPDQGLPALEPMGVLEDDLGYLWISTSQGIARASRSELDAVAAGRVDRVADVRVFGRADGLRSAEANGGVHPSAWRAEDGNLWFPTMAGLVRIDPERSALPGPIPQLLIESVTVGTRRVAASEPVSLPPGERDLEIRFAAPTFVAPEQLGMRYRLQGFDEDWILADDPPLARYTNLPPGRYLFAVELSDRDGGWTGREATLEVQAPPQLHERRVVQAAGLLAFLLLGGVGYRARIRTMERREAELVEAAAERERAAAALRRSQERLQLVLEAGRMGTWDWDVDSGEIAWSGGMERLFGPPPRSVEEFRDVLGRRIPSKASEEVTTVLDQVISRDHREFSVDFPVATPEGEVRHVELRGRWLNGNGAAAERFVGVAADVSELMKAERALRGREEELRQAQKMEAVGRLAGGVAHDFNNLLAVIGMSTRLAAQFIDGESAAHEDLDEAIQAADRATELVQQLLAFSRRQVLQPRVQDLNALVNGVERMLRRLIRANVELRVEPDPALSPIRADRSGIEQILINLVVNAQDAMPEGGTVTIATSQKAGRSDAPHPILTRPHVVLSVSDTGKGMDDETLARVFEPFFTTKGVGEGTGLGLASVYGVVQQSGGHVDVDSTVGRGTTFRVHFPRADDVEPGGAVEGG